MQDIEERNPGKNGKKLSLRQLGILLQTSHQAPLSWMDGSSVPTPTQVARLTELAGRKPEQDLVLAEWLRATDPATARAWKRIAGSLGYL